MTEPRRRRGTWTDPDSPDEPPEPDVAEPVVEDTDEGVQMVTFATVFNDRLIIPIPGQAEPITITTAGTAVPAELADVVRTAAADSHVPLRETP